MGPSCALNSVDKGDGRNLNGRVFNLTEEVTVLKKQNDLMSVKIDSLSTELTKLKIENKNLRKEVESVRPKSEENEKEKCNDDSSMAIPYAGFLRKLQGRLLENIDDIFPKEESQPTRQTRITIVYQRQKKKRQLPKPSRCRKPREVPAARNTAPSKPRKRRNGKEPMTYLRMYHELVDDLNLTGTMVDLMEEFEDFENDLDAVECMSQYDIVKDVIVAENYDKKNAEEASDYEKEYDRLNNYEKAAPTRILDVITKCIMKTPIEDTNALAARYTKRAWVYLLLDQFANARRDANKSLTFGCPEELMWHSYEILGHSCLKKDEYKEAELFFLKTLEIIFKAKIESPLHAKTSATRRIVTVIKAVHVKKGDETESKNQNETEDENDHSVPQVLNDVLHEDKPMPQVSYGVHKNFPSASSALDFIVTETRGRGVVANRDIKPGDVLIVEDPYASVLNEGVIPTHCYHCFRRVQVPIPCQSCAKVSYCSDECSAASWAGPHRLECHVLDHIFESHCGLIAALVYRLMVVLTWPKLQKMKDELNKIIDIETYQADEATNNAVVWEGTYDPQDYMTIFHFVTNAKKREFGDVFCRAITALYLTHCLKLTGYFGHEQQVDEDDFMFVASIMLRHLQGVQSSKTNITELELSAKGSTKDSRQLRIGAGIYPTASLINHSCTANTFRYCIGKTCIVVAIKTILKGEEVFENYGYYFNAMPFSERQEGLSKEFHITCQCRACSNRWPVYPYDPQVIVNFKCPQQNCGHPCKYSDNTREKCNTCGNTEEYKKFVQELDEQLILYDKGVARLKVADMEGALPFLLRHQAFLDRHAVEPVKHYTDCQEVIKLCFFYGGNNHNPQDFESN